MVVRVPREIVVDRKAGKVLIDGLPFMYPLADLTPSPQLDRDMPGIVWLPLLADRITFRAGMECNDDVPGHL